MTALAPLPHETPATDADLAVMREQLGRDMRGVVSIARRCACGRPAVVRTAPRLEDGTPFPTSLYLTLPWLTLELSRLEATGSMAELTDRLAADEQLAHAYRRAHERYLARREEIGTAGEVRDVSAGGMPTRVKCLHALAGQALAEGPGVNPVADEVLANIDGAGPQLRCRCDETARPTRPVAAIDCGTNSIRLLIVRRDERTGALIDLERELEMVRLGYGVDRTGRFDPVAVERTLEAARRYARLIDHHGADRIRFVATSATRDASNREVFIEGIREILGVTPEVISGDEEAALSFRGAVSTLEALPEGPRVVVDIGGGSTELVLGTEAPTSRVSLDMGSVRLTERHLRSDPPTAEEIAAAGADIDALLDRAEETMPLQSATSLVGVAGTVTTITAVAEGVQEYRPDAVHGSALTIGEATAVCESVLAMTRAERSAYGAIHPGRIDVIGAGALIWARILRRMAQRAGLTGARTSEHDILDGIALGLLDTTAPPSAETARTAPTAADG